MTVFALKTFALICMIIDHIGAHIPGMPIGMRWIGRLSAPIFVFCLCEGVDHTSNTKKYLLRLYLAGVLMAVIQYFTDISNNIFRTLSIIAVNLVFIREIRKGKQEYIKYYVCYILYQFLSLFFFGWLYMKDQSVLVRRLLPALAGSAAFCEWRIPWIVLGIVIYTCRKDKWKLVTGMTVFTAVYALLSLTNLTTAITDPLIAFAHNPAKAKTIIQVAFFTAASAFRPGITGRDPFTEQYQWMMIISVIPMLMYNGKKGRSMKWFFYAFYVIHILVLWYIENYMLS